MYTTSASNPQDETVSDVIVKPLTIYRAHGVKQERENEGEGIDVALERPDNTTPISRHSPSLTSLVNTSAQK